MLSVQQNGATISHIVYQKTQQAMYLFTILGKKSLMRCIWWRYSIVVVILKIHSSCNMLTRNRLTLQTLRQVYDKFAIEQ